MSWAEIEIDESGRVTVRRGGTLTGEPMAEPEPKPKLVTWRLCVWLEPSDAYGNMNEPIDNVRLVKWRPSGDIPKGWCPIEAQSQSVETIKQLPEGQQP
jgi:hypothetical protein